jgi:hypothetical protein
MAAQELYTTSLFSDANLKAYYRLESSSVDSKGTYNGSDTTISYTTGKFGNGAVFGASSNIVTTLAGTNFTTAITMSLWVNGNSTSTEDYASLVAARSSGNLLAIAMGGAGYGDKTKTYISVDAASSGTPTITVIDGSWHHVAGVYDGTNIGLYHNGTFVTQSAYGNVNSAGSNFYMGVDPGYLLTRNFVGTLDDVAIFNRVLGSQEIYNIYNGFPSGISAYRSLLGVGF